MLACSPSSQPLATRADVAKGAEPVQLGGALSISAVLYAGVKLCWYWRSGRGRGSPGSVHIEGQPKGLGAAPTAGLLLGLASAVPNTEWNHLIKAGHVSKMCCERRNSALICSPESPSAQHVLPCFLTACRAPCSSAPVIKRAQKPEPHPAVCLQAFICAGRRDVSPRGATQPLEISEYGQGLGETDLWNGIRAWG